MPDVILNVYDLIEQTPICCGFFHTGVEISGTEYSFAGGAGVYDCVPRSAQDGRFRESITLGSIETSNHARSVLDRLRADFSGDTYSLIFKNCNDFSSAYVRALLGRDIPMKINLLARLARSWPIRWFLPANMRPGASPAQAPLLSQQQSGVVAFTGEGRSLTTSGGSGASGCQASRFLSRWRGAPAAGGSDTVSHEPGDARELRAQAASRRQNSTDLEVGGG